MATSIRTRLFTGYLVVLLIGMGLAALLAWRLVETLYLDTQRENLLAQATLTAAALQGQPIPAGSAPPYQQTANTLPGIHAHVLGIQGAVLVSLPIPDGNVSGLVPPAENAAYVSTKDLLSRPEIIQAMKGQPATAIRSVSSAGNRRVLYAAAPILDEKNAPSGLVYLAMPLPQAGLPLASLLEMAGAGLAAVALAATAGTLIARRIARPVEVIARAAAAVSTGDLDQPVPEENGIHELNSLGKAFNGMTKSLRDSNQAQNAFIANVTHELRTPLTVIKGTIETLEDGALDDAVGRGPLLTSMQSETERLIRLVNDLLVLTRADAGALNLDLRPLDLVKLAGERCDHLAPLAARRGINLAVVEGDPGASACVTGDADRLSQVFDNLLDNAIRYSPDRATIAVSIRVQGDECVCAVSDSGPGIPARHLPFIFERFYRADSSRNRVTGGAGLGLAIARALVAAHGGTIHAESSEGKGATFTFRLPRPQNCHPTD